MAKFFTGMVCGAVLLLTLMHYHFVRGKNGVVMVPKVSNNLTDIYVDVREYDLDDWRSHKPLAAAILKSNQAHLMDDASFRSFGSSVNELVESLFGRKGA